MGFPTVSATWAPVAQLVELRPSVPKVMGSNPTFFLHITVRQTDRQTDRHLFVYTGVSPLIILFIIPALGLHLSNGIPSSSCFLVDGVRGVLPG